MNINLARRISITLLTLLCTITLSGTGLSAQASLAESPYHQTAQIGKGLLTKVEWRPDGKAFLMQTTLGFTLYDQDMRVIAELPKDIGPINDSAWNYDGSKFATAGNDGLVRIWDGSAGTQIAKLEGHKARVTSVEWSKDGKTLWTTSADKTIRTWDAVANKEGLVIAGHQATVAEAVLTDAGDKIVSRDSNGLLLITDLVNKQVIGGFGDAKTKVLYFKVSPDGTMVAVLAQRDPVIHMLSMSNGQPVYALEGHKISVNLVDWTRDSKTLISSGSDDVMKIWDMTTGKVIKSINGRVRWFRTWLISPDESKVLAFGFDGRARVWDLATGRQLTAYGIHRGPVLGAKWYGDSTQAMTYGLDGTIHVWDVGNGKTKFVLEDKATPAAVTYSDWNNDLTRLLSTTDNGILHLWDMTINKELTALDGYSVYMLGLAWSPDGKQLAGAGFDAVIRIWDVSGVEIKKLTGAQGTITALAWSADGKYLASGGVDRGVRIWDVASGKQIAAFSSGKNAVTTLAWSPDSQHIAVGIRETDVKKPDNNKLAIINVVKREKPIQLVGHKDSITALAWSDDGSQLASGSADKTVRIWDAVKGTQLETFTGHSDAIIGLTWTPDKITIASASKDGAILFWTAANGDITSRMDQAQASGPILWNRAESLFAAVSGVTIKIWDGTSKDALPAISGHLGPLTTIAWSTDGKLASASQDGTVRIWTKEPSSVMLVP